MDAGIIKLQVKGGDIVDFNSKIAEYCNFIERCPDKDQPVPCEGLDKTSVMFLKKFCEAHKWDKSTMKWTFPFKS